MKAGLQGDPRRHDDGKNQHGGNDLSVPAIAVPAHVFSLTRYDIQVREYRFSPGVKVSAG